MPVDIELKDLPAASSFTPTMVLVGVETSGTVADYKLTRANLAAAMATDVIPLVTPAGIGAEPAISAGTTGQYYRGDKSWQALNAAAVAGLAASATSDTTDATNISSGTIAVARLPIFVASGASHKAGAVPDPGAVAGTAKFLREDAIWATPTAGAAGGAGQIQYYSSGALAGASNLTVGSSGELVLGSMSAPTISGLGQIWTDSTRKVPSISSAGLACQLGGIVWQGLSSATAVANSVSNTSILSNIATSIGSLTIPANSLTPGKILVPRFFGTWGTSGSPNITIQVLLGATVVAQATMSSIIAGSGNGWTLEAAGAGGLQVQVINGASSKIYGYIAMRFHGGSFQILNSTGTGGAAASQITFDATANLTLDVKVQWGTASPSNTIRCDGGFLEILG